MVFYCCADSGKLFRLFYTNVVSSLDFCTYVKCVKYSLNKYAHLSSGVRGLSLHLRPYFVYESSEGTQYTAINRFSSLLVKRGLGYNLNYFGIG